MNPVREAAIAMQGARVGYPGLALKMIVDDICVTLIGHYKMRELERAVTWVAIEQGRINLLTAEVALLVNKLTANAAA